MVTPSQPTNPVSTAKFIHPALASNSAKAGEHFVSIPIRYLHTLVPFGESEELQISTIDFNGNTSLGYHAPQPDRNGMHFNHLHDPYCGQFNDSGLTQASEFSHAPGV